MKLHKYLFAISFMACIVLSLVACSNKIDYDFTDIEWVRNAPACDETIVFTKDGEYAYWCGCGSPVDGSDMYETYTYDNTDTILLHHIESDDLDDEVTILSCDEYRLVLNMPEGLRIFYKEEFSVPTGNGVYNDEIRDYSSYERIKELNSDSVVVSIPEWENDDSNCEYKLSESINYYKLSVNEDLLYGFTEEEIYTYSEISVDEANTLVTRTDAAAFLWFNDDLEVEKIVFYEKIY